MREPSTFRDTPSSPTTMHVWTPTSVKLAHYYNPKYSAAFEVLGEYLKEEPGPISMPVTLEDCPAYWEWVADGGLHELAEEHGLPIDFLRRPVSKDLVRQYLNTLECVGAHTVEYRSLYSHVQAADDKKYGPGPDADEDEWNDYYSDVMMDQIKGWDSFKEERSLIVSVEDAERREDSQDQAQEVVESETEQCRL